MAKWFEKRAFQFKENILQCTKIWRVDDDDSCMHGKIIKECVSLKIFEPSNKDV